MALNTPSCKTLQEIF
ncbi:hypothetical protein LINGRAHAP2_LOCUS7675 [Linum grandiflorum]